MYVSAVGTSFHDQCLPRGTLHLGFSSTAMHWLSAAPSALPSSVLHHTQLSASEPAAAAFAKQARTLTFDRVSSFKSHPFISELRSSALAQAPQARADDFIARLCPQAATDWDRILLARAAELAPGGRLVIANFCVDEQARQNVLSHRRRLKAPRLLIRGCDGP